MFGSLAGGQFSVVQNSPSITFSWGDPTHLITGTVKFTLVTDNTPTPRFNGVIVITGNNNANCSTAVCQALARDYPVGSTLPFDFTINLGSHPTLDAIYSHVNGAISTSGGFSSGEVPGVPEAGSIFLLGTGLLCAGTIVRYRRRNS